MRISAMRKILLLACGLGIASPLVAQAAMLKAFSQITGGTVRLGDLFDDLGGTPDRVLGPAPAPGRHRTGLQCGLAADQRRRAKRGRASR
jgi:hypothetical protein